MDSLYLSLSLFSCIKMRNLNLQSVDVRWSVDCSVKFYRSGLAHTFRPKLRALGDLETQQKDTEILGRKRKNERTNEWINKKRVVKCCKVKHRSSKVSEWEKMMMSPRSIVHGDACLIESSGDVSPGCILEPSSSFCDKCHKFVEWKTVTMHFLLSNSCRCCPQEGHSWSK